MSLLCWNWSRSVVHPLTHTQNSSTTSLCWQIQRQPRLYLTPPMSLLCWSWSRYVCTLKLYSHTHTHTNQQHYQSVFADPETAKALSDSTNEPSLLELVQVHVHQTLTNRTLPFCGVLRASTLCCYVQIIIASTLGKVGHFPTHPCFCILRAFTLCSVWILIASALGKVGHFPTLPLTSTLTAYALGKVRHFPTLPCCGVLRSSKMVWILIASAVGMIGHFPTGISHSSMLRCPVGLHTLLGVPQILALISALVGAYPGSGRGRLQLLRQIQGGGVAMDRRRVLPSRRGKNKGAYQRPGCLAIHAPETRALIRVKAVLQNKGWLSRVNDDKNSISFTGSLGGLTRALISGEAT